MKRKKISSIVFLIGILALVIGTMAYFKALEIRSEALSFYNELEHSLDVAHKRVDMVEKECKLLTENAR